MTTSGTFNFQLANSGIVYEAFDRISKRPSEVDRHMLLSARVSLNLELLSWSNESYQFWKTTSGTIPLVAGQATYTLPTNLVTIEELLYTQVGGIGVGVNNDRLMVPMERTQYAQIVNKLQGGIPTTYWFQMTIPQQVTVWEVPLAGQDGPNYVLNWYGLQQIQDANLGGGETPDIAYRAYDALCARMAMRLAEKFAPEKLKEKADLAAIAWDNLQRRDQEKGPTRISLNVSSYMRIG